MTSLRTDLSLIASLIPQRSRVLDLGCGTGDLLSHLVDHLGCDGTGVERQPEAAVAAIRKGVSVIELDLDTQLDEFATGSFDVVVLSRTLQAVTRPRAVLREMARIGHSAIVLMPNFGFWRNRVRLLRGRMPMSQDLPFKWYDTPNLHHSTLKELEPLFAKCQFSVDRRIALTEAGRPLKTPPSWANLLAGSALYSLRSHYQG